MSIPNDFDRLLRRVEKPGRYTGGEVNSIVKDRAAIQASVLLAFPDVYDIGMSYHGFKILYERVNAVPQWAAERTYAPWPDMELLMRENHVPLYALESKRSALEFDLIGFTLQHEVNFTNVLNMIDLAGVPVEAAQRQEPFPLIIAGGEGALSPETMADFIDLFVLGDGERVILELMELVERCRRQSRISKHEVLERAAKIQGVYVPSLRKDGVLYRRAAPFDLAEDLGSIKPAIPNLRVIHDRLSIEIKRGCSRGCRFCAAGMINRPVRERTPDQILEIAEKGLANTGFDEISLLSLSSADYTCILPTVKMMQQAFEAGRVSISLPSLRINSFDVELADELAQVRKSGFTFAPEAGTDRLRSVINKTLDEQAFLSIVEEVCRKGWKTLKFYFMIGLPTETDEDLDGIINLVKRAEAIGQRRWGNALQINVGLSPFVPKPHTPFQWAAQVPPEELSRRHYYVANRLRNKRISIKGHDRRLSLIEAVLARGDRHVGRALKRAWELGAKFDGWDEFFRFDLWTKAFEETGVDPAFYANRERPVEEVLPWDHIDSGPRRTFLEKEWRLALQGRTVPDCSTVSCVGCEACDGSVQHSLASSVWAPSPVTEVHKSVVSAEQSEQQRIRFKFSRQDALKYLSHLDTVKVLQLACVRANLDPAYTEGFNPRPKMSFMPPLPLGFSTSADYFDLVLIKTIEPHEALLRLNTQMPEGMEILDAVEVKLKASGPEALLESAEYQVVLRAAEFDRKLFNDSIKKFEQSEEFIFERAAKQNRPARMMDLKKTLRRIEINPSSQDGELVVTLLISHESREYADPITCLSAMMGASIPMESVVSVDRTESFFSRDV